MNLFTHESTLFIDKVPTTIKTAEQRFKQNKHIILHGFSFSKNAIKNILKSEWTCEHYRTLNAFHFQF